MSSSGPSMSLGNNNGSMGMGNYKGVMLCNRPFAGSVGKSTGPAASSGEKSFSCGVVSETVGANVSISNLEKKYPKRKKKETALTKHRKWLAELQNTKDRLEREYEEELRATQEKNDKFQKREASIRQASKEASAPKKETKSPTKAKKTKMPKPAWALTQDNAEVAEEEKGKDDEDELIKFAQGLDFDKYIDDLEIKTMMDRVQSRIQELERQSAEEKLREEESEQRAAHRAALEAKGELISDVPESEEKASGDEETYAAAKDLLAESDLKNIHSAKSVAQVYRYNKESKDDGLPSASSEPKVVVHLDDDGARMDNKNNPSNLPYIHRNPAV